MVPESRSRDQRASLGMHSRVWDPPVFGDRNQVASTKKVAVVVVKILGPQNHLLSSFLRKLYPHHHQGWHYEKGSNEELLQATKENE